MTKEGANAVVGAAIGATEKAATGATEKAASVGKED
jgi:hypothetical protein